MNKQMTLKTYEYLYQSWLDLLNQEKDTERMMFILDHMAKLDRKMDELQWGIKDEETKIVRRTT